VAGTQRPAPSIWRDTAFRRFWVAEAISEAGTAVSLVVLPIVVFTLTGSPAQTGLLTALEAVPYLLFGLLAGALADRVDRRRLMVGGDLLRAALVGSIPLAAALGVLELPHVYLAALGAAVVFVWADAASFGALPALISRDQLPAANSARWSASTTLTIAGPAVAGVLVATVGPAPALWADSASYLVSAVVLASIRRSFQHRPDPGDDPPPQRARFRRDIAEGLRFLWRHPLVRPLTLTGFGNSLTGGAVIGLLVVYGVQALGLDRGDGRLGLLYTAGAAGSLVASLLLPRLGRRVGPTRLTPAALTTNLAALIALALASLLPVALALLVVWQGTYMLVIVNGITLRQQVIPDHLQGRVNVTARMIAWGGTPFGAALGGLIAQAGGIRVAYLVMAAGVAASAALGWASPTLRQATLPQTSG
jgi:MFS family permease